MGLSRKMKNYKYGRKMKRVELVGGAGVNLQDAREREAGKDPKKQTRAVQQRMKEYRQGHTDTVIDKVKVYKNPGNK
jgi:hypothetical protein